MKPLKLGSNQATALHALVRHNGVGGWKMGSWANTERLLKGLEAKGLAKAVLVRGGTRMHAGGYRLSYADYTHYEPTPLGRLVDKGDVSLLRVK